MYSTPHNKDLGPSLEVLARLVNASEAISNLTLATVTAEGLGVKPRGKPVPESVRVHRGTSTREVEEQLAKAQSEGLLGHITATGEEARKSLVDYFRASGAAKVATAEAFDISPRTFDRVLVRSGFTAQAHEIWGQLPQVLKDQEGQIAMSAVALARQVQAALGEARKAEDAHRRKAAAHAKK